MKVKTKSLKIYGEISSLLPPPGADVGIITKTDVHCLSISGWKDFSEYLHGH